MGPPNARKTAESFRLEGNYFCKEGNFTKAVESYDNALRLIKKHSEAIPLLLNRCHARNSLKEYDAGLADANAVLNLSSNNEKAIFRAARSLYGLRRYTEAHDQLIRVTDVSSTNIAAAQDIKRCKIRLREQDGHYEFGSLLDEAIRKSPAPDMDRASFTGAVEVRPCAIKEHGKGMFTTRDVNAGELLLVEKSFCAAFPKEEEADDVPYDSATGIRSSKSLFVQRAALATAAFIRMTKNPSAAKDFARLFPGPDADEEFDPTLGHGVVNDEFVQRRIIYNAFAFPVLQRDYHWKAAHTSEQAGERVKDPNVCIGMWIQASFINHSCYPNVRRSFLGDMMVFRAQQDVPKDTELKFGYIGGFEEYEERKSSLERYGFTCHCSICECQKSFPADLKKIRSNIVEEIISHFESKTRTPLETYHILLTRLSQTYTHSPRLEPRRAFITVLPSLITACLYDNAPHEVVKLGLMLLHALGFELNVSNTTFEVTYWGLMCDELVSVLADMWTAYGTAEPRLVGQVEEVCRTSYTIMAGEGVSFEGAYGACEPDLEAGREDPEMVKLVESVRGKMGVVG